MYLLKLTGEALAKGDEHFSIHAARFIAEEIQAVVVDTTIRLAIVVGGGNVVRGAELEETGLERKVADYMFMRAGART